MDPLKRIVVQIPIRSLWDDRGDLMATREENLSRRMLKSLLDQAAIRFVVADVGHTLSWVRAGQEKEFWRSEVEIHLADEPTNLERFPGGYCYFASRWRMQSETIVLLEKSH